MRSTLKKFKMTKEKQNELLHEQGQFGSETSNEDLKSMNYEVGSGNESGSWSVPTPSGESFLAPRPRRPIDKYVCPHKLNKVHLISK